MGDNANVDEKIFKIVREERMPYCFIPCYAPY